MSGHTKIVTEQGLSVLTLWRPQRKGHARTRNESDLTIGVCWGSQREGPVKIEKEGDRMRRTHLLETPKGGRSEITEARES